MEYHKLREDPRVTKVGRFLRATSLDELPPLWNVLKGEMSGARVVGYDPVSGKGAIRVMPEGSSVVFDPYEALRGAHAAVVVTEWEEIRSLDFPRVASLMQKPPLLVDGRNAFDSYALTSAGMRYRGFGR